MNQPGSFIPRQSPGTQRKLSSRRRVYIFTYFTYIIFFCVLLLVAGLFAWGWQLSSTLAAEKAALETARTTFRPADFERVREFDAQLQLVSSIIETQPSVTKLLTALSESTAQSIQLASLEFTTSESGQDVYSIVYSGTALNFSSLLFQRSVVESNALLAGGTVTGMTYGGEGEDEEIASAVDQPVDFEITVELPVADFAYDTTPVAPATSGFESVEDETATSSEAESTTNEDTL